MPDLPVRPICFAVSLGLLSAVQAQQRFDELRSDHLPPPLDAVRAFAVMDVDGDGVSDVVVGRWLLPGAVWIGDGHGAFATSNAPGSLLRAEATTSFAAGDVNGDGQDDLVWGTSGGALRLLLAGGGVLVDAPLGWMPATSGFTTCVVLVDVDNDADLDLVVGGARGSGTGDRLLRNDGTGRFTEVVGGLPGGGSANGATGSIVAFDADQDGDVDLLMLEDIGGTRLLRNDGTGAFALAAFPSLGGNHTCGAAGDVDGDGDLDVVIGRGQSSRPTERRDLLLLNDGTGTFVDGTATRMPAIDNWTSSVHLVDVDGDGDLDVLSAHSQVLPLGDRLGFALLRGDGTGSFTDDSASLPQNDLAAGASALFDVDRDGDADLLFADPLGDVQHLYQNDRGTFVHATRTALPVRRSTTEGVAAGDLDGDGLPELIAAGWNFPILYGRTSLFWNDGTGVCEADGALALPLGIYASADVGDVDGDGDLDIVFGLDQPGQNRLLRNDGGRRFTDVTATALPQVADFTRVVRLFDADFDGDLDLLAGNTGQSTLALNDGTGVFTDVTRAALPPGFHNVRDIAVGDVDGDFDLDLAVAVHGGPNELWVNQGNGTFLRAPTRMPGLAQGTEAIALADLNGDGDLDLVVGNSTAFAGDHRSWIRFNDGTGSFTGTPIALGSVDVRAVAAGDFDADGDVDFVLGGSGTPLRLFENAGGGTFLSLAAAMPADVRSTRRLALVDLDGDGDLDLFEGGDGADRVLLALHRQLHAARRLTLGGAASFVTYVQDAGPGTAPSAVLLAGLWFGAALPTPFGALRLNPAVLVPVGVPVFAPGSDRGVLALPVPADPGLVGARIAFQAIAMPGLQASTWRLTGAAVETVR